MRVLVTIPEGEAGVYLLPDMNATVSFMKKTVEENPKSETEVMLRLVTWDGLS